VRAWSKRKWLIKKTVSVNPRRTVIVPEGVPIRLSTMGYVKSAMKKHGQRKQIPMEHGKG